MTTMPIKSKTKSTAPSQVSSDADVALMPPEDMSPEGLEAVNAGLTEYLSNQTAKERARLMKRLETADFRATACAHMNFLGRRSLYERPLTTRHSRRQTCRCFFPSIPKTRIFERCRCGFSTPKNSAQVLHELEAFGGNRATKQRRTNTIFAALEEISSRSSDKASKRKSEN